MPPYSATPLLVEEAAPRLGCLCVQVFRVVETREHSCRPGPAMGGGTS
jgi:hypothetical protein